ncbi:hypothetical protein [Flavobacterium sp.]|jgi:hypothetical protein|uniref:hypothetical protein n=1 Tax=Flavobacterium sp. TaxID=239 RepID=UPI0037C10502
MKKYVLYFVFLLVLFSCCKTPNLTFFGDDFSKGKGYEYGKVSNSWITAYKDNVFYSCIREGYKNDSIWLLMDKEDWFNTYDAIDFTDLDTAMIIGKKVIKDLPNEVYFNSQEFFSENDKSKHKNYISSTCLHYYISRELDSIAKEAFKNEVKRKTELYGKNYYPFLNEKKKK